MNTNGINSGINTPNSINTIIISNDASIAFDKNSILNTTLLKYLLFYYVTCVFCQES